MITYSNVKLCVKTGIYAIWLSEYICEMLKLNKAFDSHTRVIGSINIYSVLPKRFINLNAISVTKFKQIWFFFLITNKLDQSILIGWQSWVFMWMNH